MSQIPLALLPGTLCTAKLWEHQVAELSDIAAIQVFDTSQHDSLPDLAQYIHDAMPERFAVAGLSYGGIVALAVWRHNPAAISHLALMNTTAASVTPEKRADQLAQVEAARLGQFQNIAQVQADAILSLSRQSVERSYRSQIIEMAEAVGVEGFTNQIRAQINRLDSQPLLPQIICPTLVLCGEWDTFCPPALHQAMAAQIPNSILRIVPKCGHLSSMEQPDQVAQAMRQWLQQQPAKEKSALSA